VIIGTFIIDFQTVEFETDSKIASDMLDSFQSEFKLTDAYALDDPMDSAGWSFAKLFMAGQLVEYIYTKNEAAVNSSRGKKFEDKFISWLGLELKGKGCNAQIKIAREMKSSF
jgi:hypothetical protein